MLPRNEGEDRVVSVRRATSNDLGVLAQLFDAYRVFYRQSADQELARRFLEARLQNRESVIFLAEARDEAVGFAQLYRSFSSVRAAPIMILNDLYVRPEARRLGVATALLGAAQDVARSGGVVGLTLSTAVTNLAAQQLYETRGWVRDEEYLSYHLSTS